MRSGRSPDATLNGVTTRRHVVNAAGSRRWTSLVKEVLKVAPPPCRVSGADTVSDPQRRRASTPRVCRRAVSQWVSVVRASCFNAPISCYFGPAPLGFANWIRLRTQLSC
jgi:hypothetical protein